MFSMPRPPEVVPLDGPIAVVLDDEQQRVVGRPMTETSTEVAWACFATLTSASRVTASR